MSGKADIEIRRWQATQLAWVRRPEHDSRTFWAWEAPDGLIFCLPQGQVPVIELVGDLP